MPLQPGQIGLDVVEGLERMYVQASGTIQDEVTHPVDLVNLGLELSHEEVDLFVGHRLQWSDQRGLDVGLDSGFVNHWNSPG